MSSSWEAGQLIFRPSERLHPGTRYTISVIGSHDLTGNVIGGKGNFSFIVQPGAQVTKTLPEVDAVEVEPATVELWFSQPMDVNATNKAFGLTDTAIGGLVGGNLDLERRRHPAGLHPRHRPSRWPQVRRRLQRRSQGRGREQGRRIPLVHDQGSRRWSRSRGRRRPCAVRPWSFRRPLRQRAWPVTR